MTREGDENQESSVRAEARSAGEEEECPRPEAGRRYWG